MDWGSIIAAAIGIGATLLNRWLSKRAATREEIERWGRLAFWATVGIVQSGVADNYDGAIREWRERVVDFARAAGVDITPKQWANIEALFKRQWRLKIEASIENSLASILQTGAEIDATLRKHASRQR